MKMKMLTGLSGPEYCLNAGDERDFPEDEAQRLRDAGIAVPVSSQATERAVKAPAPEKRSKPNG